ncbi:MAG: hypothetical protein E6K78_03020 [Candidatus Eisenbacteria bacterium]|uniref:FlgD/Vpr Ig-like domain-containing protein n=1 Tax=Eiseniibacteriota bacterium TaxID=2212470 RepID=A0A538TWE6_UNCEI|nr:MAG: hypothetical protein E6K78_03020 [Candidatus Eisenbacteria bacterium]
MRLGLWPPDRTERPAQYATHFGVVPSGRYAISVSFPSNPRSRVVVDETVNQELGNTVPSTLAGHPITVFRDGRVLVYHPPSGPAWARGHSFLEAPFPNPAHGPVQWSVQMPRAAEVSAVVFDVGGRAVRRLTQGAVGPGRHAWTWSGMDDHGQPIQPGVFCRLWVDGVPSGERRIVVR